MNGVSLPTHLNSHASSVPILTGTNFSEWKEQVEFTLGVLDLDLALLKDKPDPLTDKSTPEEKTLFNTWERSDRLSIMFLRMTIASNIKTSLPKSENAKDYMKAIEERFKTADKSLAGKLMADLTTIKFDGTRSMHEHELDIKLGQSTIQARKGHHPDARREKPKLFTKAFLQPKFNTDQHQDSPISIGIYQSVAGFGSRIKNLLVP
ncbi:hypothetical protein SADUNF_Sadunf03G0056100 [Salix dunnii]|uniref:UBN2 domain-containing protein n=1 Tax=Salix dunnii TaxID=1413687 RepID=A0A835KE33_9ROSI|nr:hypothetical protein SADUNF_Sadunf03G0056100 [Salix dunnii]